MHIYNFMRLILAAGTLAATESDSFGQSGPALSFSTVCLHTNEQVYLIGTNLIPGERVTGYMMWSQKNGPIILYADANGNLRFDITDRYWLYPDGPPMSLSYEFDSWQSHVHTETNIWYQTPNENTNYWQSVIRGIDIVPAGTGGYPYVGVFVNADINPYNNRYQLQAATSLLGPWVFMGSEGPELNGHDPQYPFTSTNYSFSVFGFDPSVQSVFFRLSDPQGPCPCDFAVTNRPSR